MTAIEKGFFTPIYYPRTGWSVLKWWESRRPLYDACVGAAGLTSLGAATVLSPLPPRRDPCCSAAASSSRSA